MNDHASDPPPQQPQPPQLPQPQQPQPPLVVIKGKATEPEVAALVAVLRAVAAAAAESKPAPAFPVSGWSAPQRRLRAAYPHGPGGWRASALPR